ncbi:XkdX family protein [Paenibacillus sp. SC116]|nr:XkdX family protein [Paenibacillus sp. SC116]MCR8844200.1 XkdX family protein [Paenibacillus sp. SC116]
MFKTDYERIKYYYNCGWATTEQLKLYVKYNVITDTEMQKMISKTAQ